MHFLMNRNGKTAFASTKKAWHNLGQIVDSAMTSKEALELAQLDYNVIKTFMFVEGLDDNNNTVKITVPNKYATVREDNGEILGIVGNDYKVLQNTEAFEFFDGIIGDKYAMFETAGALGNGNRVFMTAKLPTDIIVANDDVVNKYLLLCNSHDGSKGVEIMFTPIRVVCNNTLTAALRSTTQMKFKIKHTENMKQRFDEAQKVLGIVHKASTELSEIFNIFANTTFRDEDFEKMVQELFPVVEEEKSIRTKNIQRSIERYYNIGPGQEKYVGTKWGAYNAITGYLQNVKEFSNEETKMKSLIWDSGAKLTQDVFDYLILN